MLKSILKLDRKKLTKAVAAFTAAVLVVPIGFNVSADDNEIYVDSPPVTVNTSQAFKDYLVNSAAYRGAVPNPAEIVIPDYVFSADELPAKYDAHKKNFDPNESELIEGMPPIRHQGEDGD